MNVGNATQRSKAVLKGPSLPLRGSRYVVSLILAAEGLSLAEVSYESVRSIS
jgi:hypothetical protein